MLIDGYGDGEERDRMSELWKENLEKWVSSEKLCKWNDLEFEFLFI